MLKFHSPYIFLPKTPALTAQRRISLDHYADTAQASQLALHLSLFALDVLTSHSAPSRPVEKADKRHHAGRPKIAKRHPTRSFLGIRLGRGYGTVGQWIFGTGWTVWLAYLCFAGTGNDYIHLTRRFGSIPASQLPLHYLLATFFLSSRGGLHLSLHRVTGRLLLTFFALHVILYVNFLVQMNLFWAMARKPKIVVGLASTVVFLLIAITSMQWVRRRWWRVFHSVHVVGSVVVLGLLWVHVEAVRGYLVECAAVIVMNAVVRLRGPRKDSWVGLDGKMCWR